MDNHFADQQRVGFAPEHRMALIPFAKRALIVGGVAVGVVLLLALFWHAGNVLLLIFAAILAGVFFYALSEWVQQHTSLSHGWSLAVVVLLLLALFGLSVWLFGARLADQANQMMDSLPRTVEQLQQRIQQHAWGKQLLAQGPRGGGGGSGGGGLLSTLSGFFRTTLGGLVNLIIVLVVGVYLAANPGVYTGGIVRLVPPDKRARAREVLGVTGHTLHWWLVGRIAVMTVNGVLTGLALWMLGIPMPFALGVLTGILNFIPNFGPILAAIPAILLALTEGPNKAIYVAVLYLVIQNLEGFVLTPLVQQRTVSLPPAVILISQVLLGVLAGTLGVLVATPLAATAMVMTKMLYVEDALNDPVEVPGESDESESARR